jgi:predicted outer membrane repeat protein
MRIVLARSVARAMTASAGRTGVAVTGLAVAGLVLGSAPVAQAAPGPAVVNVPCNARTLASDITAAASGETLRLAPLCRYVLTAGLPTISENLTVAGNGATLERSYTAGTPDFSILTACEGDVNISDLNFRNGNSSDGGAIDSTICDFPRSAPPTVTVTGGVFSGNTASLGGALYNDDVYNNTLIVRSATFRNNTATSGGAIYSSPTDALDTSTGLIVTGSAFTGNTATALYFLAGGGIFDGAIATVTRSTFTRNAGSGIETGPYGGAITVTDCDFSRNSGGGFYSADRSSVTGGDFTDNTAQYDGGGIADDPDATGELTVTGVTFTGNTAGLGGGLFIGDGATVTDDTFTGNSAQAGGGMYNDGAVTVTNSAFRHNSASSDGGGLYNDFYATMTGASFDQNKARSDGGGIYSTDGNEVTYYPTLVLSGSQVRGNVAGGDGGGIYTADLLGTPGIGSLALTRSQVRGNVAGTDGGGIYNFGASTVTLTSAVVARNHPDNCAPAASVPGCTG